MTGVQPKVVLVVKQVDIRQDTAADSAPPTLTAIATQEPTSAATHAVTQAELDSMIGAGDMPGLALADADVAAQWSAGLAVPGVQMEIVLVPPKLSGAEGECLSLDDYGRVAGTSTIGLEFETRSCEAGGLLRLVDDGDMCAAAATALPICAPRERLFRDCRLVDAPSMPDTFWLGADATPRTLLEQLARTGAHSPAAVGSCLNVPSAKKSYLTECIRAFEQCSICTPATQPKSTGPSRGQSGGFKCATHLALRLLSSPTGTRMRCCGQTRESGCIHNSAR